MSDITTNRKAYHLYDIRETYEAGLALTGAEIKAIRAHRVSLAGSYARFLDGVSGARKGPELYWVGGTISTVGGDPTRSRKLLLHSAEIRRLIGQLAEKGLTLVPLRLYLKRGRAKLALGLGRGKKLHDKRRALRERAMVRESQEATKRAMLNKRKL